MHNPCNALPPNKSAWIPVICCTLTEAIETAIANKDIPGAVLAVVRNGKMAYLKAYGNKRVYPNTEPMTVNTIFDMASCSKPMSTAICTHILAERGKLRLLDPVSLYIPDFKPWVSEDGKDKKIIRIADLLTHTSGLPPYAPTSELEKQYGSPSPDGIIEYIANCRRDFKPQTDFQYSCLNYITLQRIIETVSRQSLRDFARENLFDVLGMAHTDYLPLQARQEWEMDQYSSMPIGQPLPKVTGTASSLLPRSNPTGASSADKYTIHSPV